MITNYPEYSLDEIEWLREFYPNHTCDETVKAFNEHFGTEYTKAQIKHRLHKFNIKNNSDGRFKSNQEPWNKNVRIKTEYPEKYKTMYNFTNGFNFKPGHIPANIRPLMSEKEYKGVIMIKVAMPNVWVSKARYVYEQAHNVKLTDKDKILHLDGDYRNCEVDNLMLVDNAMLALLNKSGHIFTDSDLTKSAVLTHEIQRRLREIASSSKKS